jgi:hypothetical protein
MFKFIKNKANELCVEKVWGTKTYFNLKGKDLYIIVYALKHNLLINKKIEKIEKYLIKESISMDTFIEKYYNKHLVQLYLKNILQK